MKTINVSIDDARAELLAELSKRLDVEQSTLASALLSSALDETDAEAGNVSDLLDSIPGADERIAAGLADLLAGQTRPLDAL